MADRVTKVTLDAVVGGYVSGMQTAARATKGVTSEAEKLTRTNEVITSVSRTAVVAGTAVLALGAAALKTGIDYNSLQQRSRAALTTLLGSAQAANAQMDKLDEFARTSPFAKSTFITAQQQMLAFGIEARKVIPYLDAIQNAVAAAGGSNADIEGIVATMSKIQSSAKITAQDLNEFGNRGVNAAELIGSQMGMTGAQIREGITAGTIDATQALDALAAGMSERFDGAADNVKQTFEGAVDRVKAAWRDFSSELAKPLVNPNGGGALVDLLNWAADAMRAFQALPEPVKAMTSALTFGGAAIAVLGGAAVLAIPKIVAFKASLEALGLSASKATGMVGGLRGAVGALAGVAVFAWAAQAASGFFDAQREAMGLRDTVDSLIGALDELGTKKTVDKVVGSGLGNLTDGGFFSEILRGAEGFLDGAANTFGLGLPLKALGVESQLTTSKLKVLDETMAQLAGSGNTAEAAALYNELASRTNGSSEAIDALNGLLPQYMAAQSGATDATGESATEMDAFTAAAEGAQAAADAFVESLLGLGDTQLTLNDAQRKVEESLDSFYQKVAENGATLDITTEAGRQNSAALDGIAQAALNAAAATVEHTGREADAIPVIQAGRDAVVAAGIAAGLSSEQANTYADSLGLIPSNVSTTIQANWDQAIERANAVASAIRNIPGYREVVINQVVKQTGAPRGEVGAAYPGANGMMQSYADGGFASGFYQGRPGSLYKFAEPETKWEAFISGKPGMEERNRSIALEAYERLGGRLPDVAGQSGPSRQSTTNLTVMYPQASDPLRDAQEWADLVGAGANV